MSPVEWGNCIAIGSIYFDGYCKLFKAHVIDSVFLDYAYQSMLLAMNISL